MVNFNIKKRNFNRRLNRNEQIVYTHYKEVIKRLGELRKQAKVEIGYYSKKPEQVYRSCRTIERLIVEIYINYTKKSLYVYAEAVTNLKKRDISFSSTFEEVNDRFIHMSKEFARMGNGSYYVYDTILNKLVYKEDD